MLAAAGHSVIVLERGERLGGAAVSTAPFAGVGARLSRYAYLVSLFPADLLRALGVSVKVRRRPVASYTPVGPTGLLVANDDEATRASLRQLTGAEAEFLAWRRFHAMCRHLAERVFPTLTEPLRSAAELRRRVGDEKAWSAFFEEPLAAVLERTFSSDAVRGLVLTDGLIGTFASASDPRLVQNRCFVLHVIGNGTGRWDVPVGGMGALTEALADCAARAGAELRTRAETVAISPGTGSVSIETDTGVHVEARHVVATVPPRVLANLLGEEPAGAPPEGAQLKVNLLLRRLPRLRDPRVTPEQAFAGTFHCNEGYAQLESAFAQAQHGHLPDPVPCDVYCHTLTDPSILDPELREAGAHTMTVFALHMPARLFAAQPERAKDAALTADAALAGFRAGRADRGLPDGVRPTAHPASRRSPRRSSRRSWGCPVATSSTVT